MSPRLAALLRAVNVGGRPLQMAALRSCLEQAGYRDVTTILASGNVLLRSPIHPPEQLEQQLSALIEDRFGLRSAVVVRRHDQLATALATHPFADAESQPSRLHIAFFQRAPAPERIARLDPDPSPPDRVSVIGSEAYLHYPAGSARTKLTLGWLERQLDAVGTVRNLNTVTRLVALTAPEAGS
ncbi:MAG: DUF1697 domain-containing protein [Chloroflexi bacterium]|nr:DUF1697 domain-containing protein [Chloroflexota bacterium]